MITLYNENMNVAYFDTVNEYVNYLEDTPRRDNARREASDTDDFDFTGTRNLKEALDLCKYGDEKLASYVYEKTLKLDKIDTIDKHRQAYVNDIVGFTPNVPNYVMGIPNNMIRDNRHIIKSKIINVFINLSAHCGITSEQIKRNASLYVAAINQLEKEGYRCNVYTGDCGSHYGDAPYYSIIVKVKGDKEPLNLAKMAFPLCHPSMLRRLGFKWIETIPIDFTHCGYGRPLDYEKAVKKLIRTVLGDMPITVLSIGHDSGNVDNVVKQLKEKGMIKE